MDRYIIRSRALQEDSKDVIDRLKACSETLGQTVRVIMPDKEFDARVLDIAENGGLRVATAEGEQIITSGEVVHIR